MKRAKTIVAAACFGLFAGSAAADEAYDKYMANAAPIMHYSCASLAEDAGEDDARMLEVVRLMVAVSLYNRNIDLSARELSDERKAEIKTKFLAMLEEGCAADSNALLAGIVDHSVHELAGD